MNGMTLWNWHDLWLFAMYYNPTSCLRSPTPEYWERARSSCDLTNCLITLITSILQQLFGFTLTENPDSNERRFIFQHRSFINKTLLRLSKSCGLFNLMCNSVNTFRFFWLHFGYQNNNSFYQTGFLAYTKIPRQSIIHYLHFTRNWTVCTLHKSRFLTIPSGRLMPLARRRNRLNLAKFTASQMYR